MADSRKAGIPSTWPLSLLPQKGHKVPPYHAAAPRPGPVRHSVVSHPPEPISWRDRYGVEETEARSYLPLFMDAHRAYRAEGQRGSSLRPPPAGSSWASRPVAGVASGPGIGRSGHHPTPKPQRDPLRGGPDWALPLYRADELLDEATSYTVFSQHFRPRPFPMDDWRGSSKNAWIDLYRAALDHYLTEYDRASDIHSALWREVYTNPAPASAPPDPAPPAPTPAFAFRQPATGVPLFKPFDTQAGRVQTAALDPVVQLLLNRDGSGRAEPSGAAAKPSSDSRSNLEKRKQDRHGAHGQRAIGEEPRLRNQTPAPIGTPRKGTHLFGGAGMEGPYIADFVRALEEAGVQHVRAVDSERWSNGIALDVLAHITETDRDIELTGDADFGDQGEQFNLIGYSYGATQAAQAAADYADRGGKVDHLVLIGAPIGQKLLEELENHPNIGKVIVHNLEDDPIHAGMSKLDLLAATPTLWNQYDKNSETAGEGHFYYGGADAESKQRRDEFAEMLFGVGVR